jgi:hypothetical protein
MRTVIKRTLRRREKLTANGVNKKSSAIEGLHYGERRATSTRLEVGSKSKKSLVRVRVSKCLHMGLIELGHGCCHHHHHPHHGQHMITATSHR